MKIWLWLLGRAIQTFADRWRTGARRPPPPVVNAGTIG